MINVENSVVCGYWGSRTSSKGLELEIHVLIKKVTCGTTVVHCTADNVQDFWSKIKSH